MNHRTSCVVCTVAAGAAVLAAGTVVRAAPGDLDFAFGQAGRVIVDIDADNDDDWPAGLVLQPDGRIIVGRANTLEADDFSVLRFLADGSRDTSFDGDGRTSLDIPNLRGTTQSVLLQPDGKLIVAGWARDGRGSTRLALVRYLANGSIDETFGNRGLFLSALQADGTNLSMVRQPDGRLVVAGHMEQPGTSRRVAALVRVDADGQLDPSFGQAGYTYSGTTTAEWMTQLARQPDGKLLLFSDVSLPVTQNWFDWKPQIMRFHVDGAADLSFGTSGRALLVNETSFLSALLQADGKILLTAASEPYYWDIAYCGSVIVRTHSDGRLDESFGINGVADVALDGCQTMGSDILAEPDGRLVVNGSRPSIDPGGSTIDSYDYALTRLNPSGELDATFGMSGQAILDVGEGGHPPYVSSAKGLARQADGKLLVLTSGIRALVSWGNNNRIVLARLQPDGGSPGLIGIKDVELAYVGGPLEVRIRRSGGSEGIVSVDYLTNGTMRGTLVWGNGDREDKTITIDARSGTTLSLGNVTGGAGLATSQMSVPSNEPAPPGPPPGGLPPAPAARASGGGGALGWEFLLVLALGLTTAAVRARASPAARSPGLRCPSHP